MTRYLLLGFLFLLTTHQLFAIDHLSPSNFGANGKDKIDDTKSIQDCVKHAKNNKKTKIVFEPGIYYIKGTLDLSKIDGLIIEGNGATLIKPKGNYSNIIWGEYSSNISITNLIFEGNRPEKLEYKWPHMMNACAIMGKCGGIHFENCKVRNFWYGVCLGTSTPFSHDIWIKDCVFENCNSDIDLYGKPTIVISGNVSRGCSENSIQIEPAYKKDNNIFNYKEQPNIDALSVGNIVANNTIVDCKGVSINIFSGCEDIVITGNNIINYGAVGIMCSHKGASNIVVSNNVISNSTSTKRNDRPWNASGSAISLAEITNVLVNSNVIRHANSGINVESTLGATITNNRISDSKDAGVCLYGCERCLVTGNNIENYNLSDSWWASSGIVVMRSKNLLVSNSIIHTNKKSPYSIYCNESEGIVMNDILASGYTEAVSYYLNKATK